MASPQIELPVLGTELADTRFRRRNLVILLSAVVGVGLAVAWPTSVMDMSVPNRIGSDILGYNAGSTPIGGLLAGAAFAVVAGFANTLTACNFAAIGSVGALSGNSQLSPGAKALRHLSWFGAGMIAVAGIYGAVAVALGSKLPMLTATMASMNSGISSRVVQAAVVYGVAGLAFLYLGLAELQLVPSPFTALSRRLRYAPLVVLGGLVGLEAAGRPHPMPIKLLQFAANTHNPAYGALAVALQAIGGLAIIGLVSLALTYGTRGRFERWMSARPGRMASLTSAGFLIAGIFTLVFWDIRLGR